MTVKVATLKSGRVVKIINDGNARVIRDAKTDEYITRVWKFKSRWMHMLSSGRYNSMIRAIESAIIWAEMRSVT